MIDVDPEFLAFLKDEEARAEDADTDERRAVAIDFYNGEPFGDEEEGRRVFNNIGRYDPRYKFSSWIFKIATNLTIDWIRRKEVDTVSIDGSRNAVSADEIEATSITVVSRDENPEELLEAKQLGNEIESAIGKLRPEYRAAILLRHVDGREYQEIAEILSLPLGTVKTYIHRGRNELREHLAHLRAA